MVKHGSLSRFLALPGILIDWARGTVLPKRVHHQLRRALDERLTIPAMLLSYQPTYPRVTTGGSLYEYIPTGILPSKNVPSSSTRFNLNAHAAHRLLISSSLKRDFSISVRILESDNSKSLPDHSVLHPPKLPPSVWQIYFMDWLENKRISGGKDTKLNVALEAKEAAISYNKLSDEERNDLTVRYKLLKVEYERELTVWKKSITPADVERENAFRKGQRMSGKSRRKNIADPNAPKKPTSAYFLFLQTIRTDPVMVKEIFGYETEPPKQSVMAAAKWRSMTEEEKEPYLTQAANAKSQYELEQQEYEARTQATEQANGLEIRAFRYDRVWGGVNDVIKSK